MREGERSRVFRLAPRIFAAILGAAAGARAQPPAPDGGAPSKQRYDGHALVRIDVASLADLRIAGQISPDMWSERAGAGPVDFRIPPGGIELLDETGLSYEILSDDIQTLIDAEAASLAATAQRAGASFFDDYRALDEVAGFLDDLEALRPDLVERITAGETLEGRPIEGVRIRGLIERDRPAFLITGGQHAREWISVMTAAWIADALVRGYDTTPAIRAALDGVEFIVIPVVNADGYVYSWTSDRLWRKNRRPNPGGSFGVDPNRNWSTGWGLNSGSSPDPGHEEYRGPAPFSEPCVSSLRDFIEARPHIRRHLDLHSYSQLVLGAWGHTTTPAPDSAVLTPIGQSLAVAITSRNGAPYMFHTAGGPIGLASGVLPDWMYEQRAAFSWTIELRDRGAHGFLLPAAQIVPTSEEAFAGVMHLATRLAQPLAVTLPDGPPAFVSTHAPTRTGVRAAAAPINGGALVPGSLRVLARVGDAGPFAEAPPLPLPGGAVEGLLPLAPCGQTVQFFVEARSIEGAVVTSPPDAPRTLHAAEARGGLFTFHDDFEVHRGWVVGTPNDSATGGVWVRAIPVATIAQPGEDNPWGEGDFCFVTGNGAPGAGSGEADVDGGFTTLTSPLIDATGEGDAYVSYYRWYSNDRGANPNTETMLIDISANGGQTWTRLETVAENAERWVFRQWRVADFAARTAQVRIRFVARDFPQNGGALVEAAVDDVRLTLVRCVPGVFGDVNGDGVVSAADLGLLLGAWGPCAGAPAPCPADLSGDGVVSAADLGMLLGAWN